MLLAGLRIKQLGICWLVLLLRLAPRASATSLLFNSLLFRAKAHGSQRYAPAIFRRNSKGQSVVSARILPTANSSAPVNERRGNCLNSPVETPSRLTPYQSTG